MMCWAIHVGHSMAAPRFKHMSYEINMPPQPLLALRSGVGKWAQGKLWQTDTTLHPWVDVVRLVSLFNVTTEKLK